MAADTRVLLVFVLVCFSGDGAWGKKEMLATEREGERWTVSLLAGSGEAGVRAQLPRTPRSVESRDAMQLLSSR